MESEYGHQVVNRKSKNATSSRSVLVNGVELHCTISGTGSHPILCIPGALAPSHWAFVSQLEYFGREGSDYTIVAYDPRGYGYSYHHETQSRSFQLAPEHHLMTDARDAHELMKSLGYSQFSVLGWCSGGITATYLAALFPEAVLKLVIWGSRTYFTEDDVEKTRALEDTKAWNPNFRETFEAVYGSKGLMSLWKEFSNSVQTIHTQRNGINISIEQMSKVVSPTLILHGAKDAFTSHSHPLYTKSCIFQSRLAVLPDGKHGLQWSTDFNYLVETFLSLC